MQAIATAAALLWFKVAIASGASFLPSSESQPAVGILKLGELAPPLKASKWVRGDPITQFEPGKVYVVEFWATWCGALHGFIPYLNGVHDRYKDQGVTIICFTARDIRGVVGNTEEEVTAFVQQQRPPLRYSIAYGSDSTTTDAWLKAAGQKGFCTFVVDKKGRIAYMGHPMFLDIVLPRALAGMDAKAAGEEMNRIVAEYENVHEGLVRDFQAGRDLKPGLRALEDFEARYPAVGDLLPIQRARLSLLPRHGKPGEGKAYAEAIVAKAIKQQDVVVLDLAYSILRNETANKDLLPLALKAAQERVRMDGGRDPRSLLNLADAWMVNSDTAKGKEVARKAIEAAVGESPAVQQEIEKEARRLGAGK